MSYEERMLVNDLHDTVRTLLEGECRDAQDWMELGMQLTRFGVRALDVADAKRQAADLATA